ncbi:ankyrin repeat domain-containing protein [Legionella sp. CNM-4043-24]|uniref:ankyrin repeat domain-containing protein n=1 Tax=Legionella sp. CNM-4043-24 TaxID=3421646 RepID=UPI00403A9BAD
MFENIATWFKNPSDFWYEAAMRSDIDRMNFHWRPWYDLQMAFCGNPNGVDTHFLINAVTLRWLLEKNLSLDARNGKGETPLHVAIFLRDAALTREILEKNGNRYLGDNQNYCLRMPIHYAALSSVAVMRLLFEYGAGRYIHETDMNGETPLHVAARACNPGVVSFLLKNGAHTDIHTVSNRTVAWSEHRRNRYAASHGFPSRDGFEDFVDGTATPFAAALYYAQDRSPKRTRTLQLLIDYGCDIYIVKETLHDACQASHPYVGVIRLLLDYGAHQFVNAVYSSCQYGPTPLHALNRHFREVVIPFQLFRRTEYYNPYVSQNEMREIAHTLVNAGANLDAVDKKGKTPLINMIYNKKNPGFPTYKLTFRKSRRRDLSPTLTRDVHFKDNVGATVLLRAASAGKNRLIDDLVRRGANVDERDKSGYNALIWAAACGHNQTIDHLVLHHNANIFCRTCKGTTLLGVAAFYGKADTVNHLLGKYKLDILAKNNLNETPAMLARERGHTILARYLEDIAAGTRSARPSSTMSPVSGSSYYSSSSSCSSSSSSCSSSSSSCSSSSSSGSSSSSSGSSSSSSYSWSSPSGSSSSSSAFPAGSSLNRSPQGKKIPQAIIDRLSETRNALIKILVLSLRAQPSQAIDSAIYMTAEQYVSEHNPRIRTETVSIQDAYVESIADVIKQKLGAIYMQIQEFQSEGNSRQILKLPRGDTKAVDSQSNDWGYTVNTEQDKINIALMAAASEGDRMSVERLINLGAEVNACDKEGNTALLFAAGNGHIDVIALLVRLGADVNVRNRYGLNALMWATKGGKNDTIDYLVNYHGADVHATDNQGNTALSLAMVGQPDRTTITHLALFYPLDSYETNKAEQRARLLGYNDSVEHLRAVMAMRHAKSLSEPITTSDMPAGSSCTEAGSPYRPTNILSSASSFTLFGQSAVRPGSDNVLADSRHPVVAAEDDAPRHLLDPISSELMTNPVTLTESGQVYQRESIEACLANKMACPVSNITIVSATMTPASVVRDTVEFYLASKGFKTIESYLVAKEELKQLNSQPDGLFS